MRLRDKGGIEDVRLLTAEQAQRYAGMGRMSFRKWADGIGATRKMGRRVMFDKVVIDKALDDMAVSGEKVLVECAE